MRIDDILKRKGDLVLTVLPETTIIEAAHIMSENRIGLLVVCSESGKVIGVLSERDIVRGLAQYPDYITGMTVDQLATMNVETCEIDDNPQAVLNRMGELGIRHMPVVQYGKLKGMVSNRDLYRFLMHETDMSEKAIMMTEFNYL